MFNFCVQNGEMVENKNNCLSYTPELGYFLNLTLLDNPLGNYKCKVLNSTDDDYVSIKLGKGTGKPPIAILCDNLVRVVFNILSELLFFFSKIILFAWWRRQECRHSTQELHNITHSSAICPGPCSKTSLCGTWNGRMGATRRWTLNRKVGCLKYSYDKHFLNPQL